MGITIILYHRWCAWVNRGRNILKIIQSSKWQTREAVPSALEKADGWYRWQVVVRAPSVSTIVKAWRWLLAQRPPPAALRAAIDVDAFSLI